MNYRAPDVENCLCSLLANLVVDAADSVLPEFGKQLENSGRTLNQNEI
jgi:hypothetical protein